jgi:hypothetical protein
VLVPLLKKRKSPGDEAERQPSHASSSEPTFLLKNGRNQLSVSSSASEFGMGPNFTPTARESDSLTPAAPLPPASLPFPSLSLSPASSARFRRCLQAATKRICVGHQKWLAERSPRRRINYDSELKRRHILRENFCEVCGGGRGIFFPYYY